VTTFFIVTEALVGAGLVLFEMVAGNKSLARAAWIASHLVNTFALLAAMVITRWLAGRTDDPPPPEPSPSRGAIAALACGLGATVLVATSGAVAALGDTLFPARSLAEGLQQDLSAASHLFLRLRVFHPVLAVASAAYLVVVAALLASRVRGARHLFTALGALVLTQVAVGLLNLVLLAPIPLQILHLLLADLVWITLVLATSTLWRARASSA
jgi:heme A synthase